MGQLKNRLFGGSATESLSIVEVTGQEGKADFELRGNECVFELEVTTHANFTETTQLCTVKFTEPKPEGTWVLCVWSAFTQETKDHNIRATPSEAGILFESMTGTLDADTTYGLQAMVTYLS